MVSALGLRRVERQWVAVDEDGVLVVAMVIVVVVVVAVVATAGVAPGSWMFVAMALSATACAGRRRGRVGRWMPLR